MSSAAAMLNRFRQARRHDAFMAFSSDPDTCEVLTRFAESREWPASAVQEGGISAAIQVLVTTKSSERLVVDLSDNADPIAAVEMLRDTCAPETVILALGTVNDIHIYRDLLRAGAADYLVKPVSPETIGEAMDRALHARASGEMPAGAPEEAATGRLVIVLGARGGVGASTIAMNTAWLLAHERKARIALVDLDLQFGTMALNLDLEPSHGLREALENPSRIDGLFIASAMVSESETLSVLAGEEPLEDVVEFDPHAAGLLFEELRQNFDCVIVDLPRSVLARNQGLLSAATEIALVCDLSLPCVRDTMRTISLVRDLAPNARVLVVANRVHGGGKGQISKRDFERGIECRVDLLVPEDVKVATASANAGRPLAVVGKRTALVRSLRQLADALHSKAEPEGGARRRRLFRFRKKA